MYLYFICCVVLFVIRINCIQIIGNPDSADIRHELVQPVMHHARTKRQLTTTKHAEGVHHPEVTMMVDIDGELHVLDLRLNSYLVGGDHVICYQKDGNTILHKPTVKELDICQYSGKVRGKESSWVALSTCHGVRGIIHDGKRMKYIEPAEGSNVNSKHFIYHYSDLNLNNTFGTDGLYRDVNMKQVLNLTEKYKEEGVMENNVARHKRDSNMDEKILRGPFGANRDSRYLELVLVADNSIYNSKGKNITMVHRYLQETANVINSLYAQLNVYVALVGVVVWNERDEIKLVDKIHETLENFLKYRKEKILPSIPHDNAQFLTKFIFESALMNHGLLRSICSQNYSGGVNTITNVTHDSGTIVHTIGHNFGLNHDSSDCVCEGKTCMMSPFITSVPPTHWSYCSFTELALVFSLGVDYCLRNKPKSVYGSSCGNGFVEVGEQCDCGVDLLASSCVKCCDPNTCLFLPNATCSVGECCDTYTCQPKNIGALCREARKECDLPEYCNGYSEHCPQDVYKMDTTPCSHDQAYCVNGECGTHTDQCQLIWGPTSKMANSVCYININNLRSTHGVCGYKDPASMKRPKYKSCSAQDALCGLLHCQFEDDTDVFKYTEKYEVEIQEKIANDEDGTSSVPCISTTRFNYGMSVVPFGLVPDGAKCGKEKMCLNHKCVSIATVSKNMTKLETSICPSNCSGHGVCNSKGHCHCDFGFGPPYCEHVVVGGSLDSGPAIFGEYLEHHITDQYAQTLNLIRNKEDINLITEINENKGSSGRSSSILTIMLILIYYLIF